MAQLITVRLSRDGGSPWGFRLQGGKDFGTPLVIQKVNGGSPAERAGLIAGDSVIKVNTTDVFNLRHKDAQDVIVRAGQTFEMTVQRGGSTWKPAVTPVGSIPRSQQPLSNNVSPVTKTSLAAQKQDISAIGTSHNLSPKGFNTPHVNGDGPKLVNKQYNSPIGLYSEQSIAETLSAQAEVLSTGALGVNFKKNEKNYDAEKSEVYKMLQEAEREPRTPEPAETDSGVVSAPIVAVSAPVGPTGLRHVPAPIDRPAPPPVSAPGNPQLPPGQNICADCERLIVGVFVRIKEKNLHVECFKCATCGSSLKNVGYYNINNKLYCDIHAKLAARSNPPAPNMVPVTIPPGGKVPAGTISAALSSHSLPSPSPLSPSGNQVAAPFSPQPYQDTVDRHSPNNNYNPQKIDAVSNLMSALTMATQKDFKENGTNTDSAIYLTEKIIPINNNFDKNNFGIRDDQIHSPPPTVKYMPFRPKSASSFSGPKPFSSVTPSSHAPFSPPINAPVASPLSNTLPRTGPASTPGRFPSVKPAPAFSRERKEWPPSKPEDIPTASPLYIDPSTRASIPRQKNPDSHSSQTSQVDQNPETQTPSENLPFIPIPKSPFPQFIVPQNVPPEIKYANPQPSQTQMAQTQPTQNPGHQVYASQNPGHQVYASQNPGHQVYASQNPGHQIYASQNPGPQMIQNPGPQMNQNPIPHITISRNSVSEAVLSEATKSKCKELSSQYQSSSEVSNFERNMSICSAEVTNITDSKVTESTETVSDAINTQVSISQVTRTKERPKSPPPIQRKDSVYDTQDISVVVSTDTPGGKNPGSGNPVLIFANKSNIENICNPQICANNPCPTCPMKNPGNPTHTTNVQQNKTGIHFVDESQESANIQTTSTSKIKNPIPEGYRSPMVKALTVASDRPFNTVSIEIKSKEYGREQAQEVIETTSTSTSSLQTKQQVKAVQERKTVQKTKEVQKSKHQESKKVKTAKETKELKEIRAQVQHQESFSSRNEQEIVKSESKVESRFPHAPVSGLTSALTIAPSTPFTPSSQFTMEHVPLPPETTPYFPPEASLVVEPKVSKQPTTCKNTFLDALITAPDRPYTPLGTENEQSGTPDYMKDLPPPSSQKMSMLSALTVATERPFTPALSVGSIEDILLKPPEPAKPQHKTVSTSSPHPLTIKPASHVSPSAFKPIGNSSFNPVIQQYVPQEIPKTVAQFPPVSEEFRYTSTPQSGYSVQQQFISQQEMDQYARQIQRDVEAQHTRKSDTYGLHSATSIPEYQKSLTRRESGPVFVPQSQAPAQHVQKHVQSAQKPITTGPHGQFQSVQKPINQFQPVQNPGATLQSEQYQPVQKPSTTLHPGQYQPIQKPVTTLQPGQYQPNNHLQTFQPVRSTSPVPRSVSPSMINKPAPSIPYYQADIIAHECAAVGSNILDPRSPGISRSPSPCPGMRSTSPFPRTMAKSPAPGPPPNPLEKRARASQPPPVRDERYLEARENLTGYIPIYQDRDEEIKSHLSLSRAQSRASQCSGQTQVSTQSQTRQYGAQSQPSRHNTQSQLSQYSIQSQSTQYSAQSQPSQYSVQSQPLQYSSQSQPSQYAQPGPQPVQYNGHSQPVQYSGQSQTVKYSAQPVQQTTQQYSTQQPVQYSGQTQSVKYSAQPVQQSTQQYSTQQPLQYSGQTQSEQYRAQPIEYSSHSESVQYSAQSHPEQYSAQAQKSSIEYQESTRQSQLGGKKHTSTKSQNYQNVELAHAEHQQQTQNYKRSEVEDVRHMEQLNKSQVKSVETSADNRIQIQRTKRCTEEYERTQKERTIEIQKTGYGQQRNIGQITQSGMSSHTQVSQGVSSAALNQKLNSQMTRTGYSTDQQKICQTGFSGSGQTQVSTAVDQQYVNQGVSPGFYRQTSLTQPAPPASKFPVKPLPPAVGARSYSFPDATAPIPKQTKPSPLAATVPKAPVSSQSASRPNVPQPYVGGAGGGASGRQSSAILAPKRGRGVLNLASTPGSRVPMCGQCNMHIRGPFITALGKIWCPEHFICTTPSCRRPLQDMGFVEEKGQLYCEYCFEQYLAPICAKCNSKIKGDCLNAIGKHFHPECFACAYCSKLFGNSPFFLEDGLPYCEADWNELFTTKCFACGFPVEAGDRWVEALNNNYHSQCFNCTMCKKNLEGQSFYAKGGRPFCKNHAR